MECESGIHCILTKAASDMQKMNQKTKRKQWTKKWTLLNNYLENNIIKKSGRENVYIHDSFYFMSDLVSKLWNNNNK